MKLLDACLALALTLAVFASAVTAIMEFVQRAWGERVKQLRAMLGAAFDQHLAKPLQAAGADVAALRECFVASASERHGARSIQAAQKQLSRAPTSEEARATPPLAVDRLTLEDLLHRLGRNEEFRAAMASIEATALRPTLAALAEGFTRLEADASALFATRARQLSFLFGVVIALLANVDAVRLFNYYASDPAGTAKVVAELAATRPVVANASGNHNADTQIAETITELRGYAAVGVPVGWGFFPYCEPPAGQTTLDALCKVELDWKEWLRHFVFWALSAVVTGLLLGLGGPYWYDIVASLSQWRHLLRGAAAALAARGAAGDAAKLSANAPSAASPEQSLQAHIDEFVRLCMTQTKPSP